MKEKTKPEKSLEKGVSLVPNARANQDSVGLNSSSKQNFSGKRIKEQIKDCIPDDECNTHLRDTHWIYDIEKLIEEREQLVRKECEKEFSDNYNKDITEAEQEGYEKGFKDERNKGMEGMKICRR